MAIVKDLSLVAQEPLELRFSEDIVFTIPSDPKLDFTYKLMNFEEKMSNAKTNKEQFDLLVEMVTLILSQDESKEIDKEFIKKNLHISQMQGVVQIYQQQAMENHNNPN